MDDPRPWAVVDAEGRRAHFHTETGARTRAALDRARGVAVVVEHRDADGWHECVSHAERIPPAPPAGPPRHGPEELALLDAKWARRKAGNRANYIRRKARRPELEGGNP